MTNLIKYSNQLAVKIQQTWEESVRLDFLKQLREAEDEILRMDLLTNINYQREGLYDYGRHYHVQETDNEYRIVYDCEVGGMPMVHCVINKETGDLAKYTTELVNEMYFQYNLLDPRSRESCLSQASYTSDYLS
mgnify:CR=1 FL=1